MRLLLDLSGAFIVGFLGHVIARPILKRDFDGGWLSIISYATGVIMTLPFVALMFSRFGRDRTRHLIASYLLAYLGVGSGVVVGY